MIHLKATEADWLALISKLHAFAHWRNRVIDGGRGRLGPLMRLFAIAYNMKPSLKTIFQKSSQPIDYKIISLIFILLFKRIYDCYFRSSLV